LYHVFDTECTLVLAAIVKSSVWNAGKPL
jgi:hypothetical protein